MMIEFTYTPLTWDDAAWLKAGGFVAVVLGYNHSASIEEAIAGAFAQDYPTFEVYLMDDCSKDDTLERMLAAAKRFAETNTRPIKVTVVKNETNQSVCGQWNTVARLSKGKWFGMFCGDDVSFPNRISVAAEIVKRHPTAYGLCTNFICKGGKTDGEVYFHRFEDERVWSGTDADLPLTWTLGCAAFWNQALFEAPLVRFNIDDHLLLWRVLSLRCGTPDVAMVWAMDKVTVRYSATTGVTNKLPVELTGREPRVAWAWRVAKAEMKMVDQNQWPMWGKVRDFDDQYGHEGHVRERIRGYCRISDCYSGSVVHRISAAMRILIWERNDNYGGSRSAVIYGLKHGYLKYLFGTTGIFLWRLCGMPRIRWIRPIPCMDASSIHSTPGGFSCGGL